MSDLLRGVPTLVVGAGIMGAGIVQVAALAGHHVQLFDMREGAAAQALDKLATTLKSLVDKGRLSPDASQSALARISPIATLAEAHDVRLVVEAIVEKLDVKRALFKQLEAIVATDCVLATNTSSISVTALANGLAHPARLVGMHFFNPVPLMKLVEVVSGLHTEPAVAEAIFALSQAWGKVPVHAKSTPGFIVNRIARPFYAETLALLQEQAAEPQVLDKWFAIQARDPNPDVLERVIALTRHPAFEPTNPNRLRALVSTFANFNPARFHDPSGGGYRFLADQILAVDKFNPMTAARLIEPLGAWRRYRSDLGGLMRQELERIAAHEDLATHLQHRRIDAAQPPRQAGDGAHGVRDVLAGLAVTPGGGLAGGLQVTQRAGGEPAQLAGQEVQRRGPGLFRHLGDGRTHPRGSTVADAVAGRRQRVDAQGHAQPLQAQHLFQHKGLGQLGKHAHQQPDGAARLRLGVGVHGGAWKGWGDEGRTAGAGLRPASARPSAGWTPAG